MSTNRSGVGSSSSVSRTPGNSSNFTGDPISPPSGWDAEFSDRGTIADQVRNSKAYKTAYQIFSQLSDKSWLNRLIAIPTSVQDASSSWFDENGLSNKFNDKQSANYQYCIQQIQNLMAEYYAWKNSLPITQVDQAQDAGFNSAITGNGVDTSSMDPAMLQSDPSALQSTDTLSCLQSFIGAMSSISGGISSIVQTGIGMYSSLASVRRADDQQAFDFALKLDELGYLHHDLVGSYDDNGNYIPGKRLNLSTALQMMTSNYDQKDTIRTNKLQKDASKSSVESNYWSAVEEVFMTEGADAYHDLAQLSYDLAMIQRETSVTKERYNRDYFDSLNPGNMAQYDEITAKYNSLMSQLGYETESKFRSHYWEIVDKWKKKADNGSWLHSQLLSTLLTGYNPFSFGYNAFTTPAKDFMNMGKQVADTALKAL